MDYLYSNKILGTQATFHSKRKVTLKFFIATLLIFFISYHGYSATYTVRSAREAQSRLNTALPGDIIIVQNGTYTNFNVTITRNGNPDKPILIKSQDGGKVNFTGNSGFKITGDYVVVDGFQFSNVKRMNGSESRVVIFDNAQFSKLTNCAFYTCGNHHFTHIVLLTNGSSNNEIFNNYLENIVGQGIGVNGSANNKNNQIHHNHINGTKNDGRNNGQEPIQVGQDKKHFNNELNTLVEYNLIENMTGDADNELISNKAKGNTFRYNTFINNDKIKNFTLRGGNDCIVESNYFDGSGIRAYGTGHKIKNNTIKNSDWGILLPGGGKIGETILYADTYNVEIKNNTIVNTARYGIKIGEKVGKKPGTIRKITVDNNKINSNKGTLYFLNKVNGGGMHWTRNIGQGNGQLKSTNITSGVSKGTVDTSGILKPIDYCEVGPNWLKGKNCNDSCLPVYASADNNGSIAENTLDNDLSTRWSAEGDGQFIEYCLDKITVLNNIAIAFYKGDIRTATFDVSVSRNGQEYATVLSKQVSSGETLALQEFSFTPVEAKKIRITGYGNSENKWNSITEVKWDNSITPPTTEDCDQSVIASSYQTGNTPGNTLDNDLSTRWSAEGDGEYIEYCLDKITVLNSVSIAFQYGNARTATFDLSVSEDGTAFQTILSKQVSSGKTTGLQEFSFAPVKAKKIRITGYGNSDSKWNSITEMKWNANATNKNPGAGQITHNKIKAHPNPTKGATTITGIEEGETVRLYDLTGRLVIKEISLGNMVQLDLQELQQGTYFIKTSTKKTVQILKN